MIIDLDNLGKIILNWPVCPSHGFAIMNDFVNFGWDIIIYSS